VWINAYEYINDILIYNHPLYSFSQICMDNESKNSST
jgi:hypothetical protein